MKTRLAVSIFIFVLLAATIPWFFIGAETSDSAGLPGWVIYALGMNLLFPFVVAVLHERFWKVFEGEEDHTR